METTHAILDVRAKTGTKHNPWHNEIIGRPCIPLECVVGRPAWLAVETEDDPGVLHRFKTSPVVWASLESALGRNADQLVIETQNTVYVIHRLFDGGISCRTSNGWTLDNYKTLV